MADNGNGGLIPQRHGFMVHNTRTGDVECYIPIAPDPERTARNMAIWREAAERLGIVLPPAETKDDGDA